MARKGYPTIAVTTELRDQINRTAVSFTARAERRLSAADVVRSSLAVALRYPDEFAQELTVRPVPESSTQA